MRGLLVRGMIAGAVAGLVYVVFAVVFGEPQLDRAIAFEGRVAAAAGEELVSRTVQSTLGLGVAALVYGVAIGGIFALVHAAIHGRVGRLSPRASAAVLALVGFGVLYVVPFLKYPANPPASSLDDTIGLRTGLYVVMVVLSVAVAVAAVLLRAKLLARLGAWNATLVGVAGYLVVIGIVMALLPAVAETPSDFPATVLYDFRLASLGGQLVLWTVLGLVFGALVGGSPRRARPAVDAAAG